MVVHPGGSPCVACRATRPATAPYPGDDDAGPVERPPAARVAGASRWTAPPCGSCARRAATSPSTGSSGGPTTSSRRAGARSGSWRSRCSRCAGCRRGRRDPVLRHHGAARGDRGPVRIEAGRGPVLDEPIRDAAGRRAAPPLEPEADVPYVLEAIRLLVKELDVPLIGFAGAPFTLASYLIEGGPTPTFAATKALMLGEPARVRPSSWRRSPSIAIAHLRAQVEAGARACRSSTPGSARSTATTTDAPCSRTSAGCSRDRRHRRADDPLRGRDRPPARPDAGGGGRRRRRRPPPPARRRVGGDRPRPRDPGEPRPRGAAGPLGRGRAEGARRPRAGRRTARPRLQPRARRAPGHAGRASPAAGRPRPRARPRGGRRERAHRACW